MFKPLAYTKTFAIIFSSLLAITIVPILMVFLVRARRYRLETENPVAHFFQWLYTPIIRWCLRHRWCTQRGPFLHRAGRRAHAVAFDDARRVRG